MDSNFSRMELFQKSPSGYSAAEQKRSFGTWMTGNDTA